MLRPKTPEFPAKAQSRKADLVGLRHDLATDDKAFAAYFSSA
jgi:hypothetical protein